MQDLICTYLCSSCMPLYNVKRLLNMCIKHNGYTDFHLFLIEKRNWSIIGDYRLKKLADYRPINRLGRLIGSSLLVSNSK